MKMAKDRSLQDAVSEARESNWGRQLGVVLAHLRLPIQATLAPLYLWGVYASAGSGTVATVAAFVSIHVFLYGGTTLFNSYYDRDEGPISGMEHPPRLPGWALPFSLAWLFAGAAIMLPLGAALTALYAVYAIIGLLYSYPRVRLKARPFLSAALIAVVQGFGGFLAGVLAGSGTGLIDQPHVWLMGLTASLTILAFYPLTQVYQLEEDAARGDRTLAAVLGPARSFAFATVLLCGAALAGSAALVMIARVWAAVLLLCGYAGIVAATVIVGRGYTDATLLVIYRRVLALQVGSALGLAFFVVLQALLPA